MLSGFETRQLLPATVLAAALVAIFSAPAQSEETLALIGIEPDGRSPEVVRYRLANYLEAEGCPAEIRFTSHDPEMALIFRRGVPGIGEPPVLVAVNRSGTLPAPAWTTRRTAGVRHIGELRDRDLAIVVGHDPLAAELPLAALRQAGVSPEPEQLYRAGDYSSALGLLLHNNTHAAVSEAGFVEPFLDKNDLVVSWTGKPVVAAGWYREAGWNEAVTACERALTRAHRENDRQAFAAFPEWVNGFARHNSQNSEDSDR